MRVYVAKKMNENITSDHATLKVRADGEVKVEVYNYILPITNSENSPLKLRSNFSQHFIHGQTCC